jgi:hypothetical protein
MTLAVLSRRKLLPLLASPFILSLGACGDDHTRAFAEFLQKRVLDRPGVHIPLLSDEERVAIGPYDADFAILKGYNDDLSAALRDFGDALHPAPKNVPPLDLPQYKPDLLKARDFFPRASAAVESAFSKAQAARAQLKLPELVKTKYDAAFDQLVTAPANAMREIVPLAVPAMNAEIAVVDFIEAHRAELKMGGGKLLVSKPGLRKQLEALLANYSASFAKVQESRRKLELVVQGN